jgi:hypothetical protein
MEVSGQLHASAALPTEKEPPLPLDRRLGGPQSRSGRGGEVTRCNWRNLKMSVTAHSEKNAAYYICMQYETFADTPTDLQNDSAISCSGSSKNIKIQLFSVHRS